MELYQGSLSTLLPGAEFFHSDIDGYTMLKDYTTIVVKQGFYVEGKPTSSPGVLAPGDKMPIPDDLMDHLCSDDVKNSKPGQSVSSLLSGWGVPWASSASRLNIACGPVAMAMAAMFTF